jgi:hypothetical protein
MQRMADNQIPKKIVTQNSKRKQNLGRPHVSWKNQHAPQEDATDHVWATP